MTLTDSDSGFSVIVSSDQRLNSVAIMLSSWA